MWLTLACSKRSLLHLALIKKGLRHMKHFQPCYGKMLLHLALIKKGLRLPNLASVEERRAFYTLP